MSRVRSCDLQQVLEHPILDRLGFLYQVIQFLVEYGQVIVHNLAAGELLIRRTQQLRHALSLNAVRPVVGDSDLPLGNQGEDTMEPELNEYVANRMKSRQKLLKEKRLLNDERNPKGKNGGPQKGGAG